MDISEYQNLENKSSNAFKKINKNNKVNISKCSNHKKKLPQICSKSNKKYQLIWIGKNIFTIILKTKKNLKN